MLKLKSFLSVLLGFLSFVVLIPTMAQQMKEVTVTTTTPTIVTEVPAAKETVVAPTGYVNCFTVAAGWFQDVWVPAHKVCQYEKSQSGVAWIDGYWACTKYTVDGICSTWDWKPGRWVKTFEVY